MPLLQKQFIFPPSGAGLLQLGGETGQLLRRDCAGRLGTQRIQPMRASPSTSVWDMEIAAQIPGILSQNIPISPVATAGCGSFKENGWTFPCRRLILTA